MKSVEPESHNEIIIVRRGGNDDDSDHHGGAWEVAYADFMTSMMAFFLVMWLINAANDETKAALASYFNPIKLVDRRTNPRGIQDNDIIDNIKRSRNDAVDKVDEKSAGNAEQQKIMSEPFEALDKIADQVAIDLNRTQGAGGSSEGGTQKGASQGTAYQDPFSPDYWSKNASSEISDISGGAGEQPAEQKKTTSEQTKDGQKLVVLAGDIENGAQATSRQSLPGASSSENLDKDVNATIKTDNKQSNHHALVEPDKPEEKSIDKPATSDNLPKSVTPQEAAKDASLPEEVREISNELSKLINESNNNDQPMVRIVHVKDGVAIELMDQMSYGMFSVGSAKPDKKTVDLLDGIAKILQKKEGDVIISGHTDARPYKSATYDNWQLSSSRAQMAYYMLIRGGLDEKRVLRVEGYADRKLKNKDDPYAAENRRIEIFMRLPQSDSEPQPVQIDKVGQTQ